MNRRDFLTRVGRAGGAAALYNAMGALDLVPLDGPAKFQLAATGAGPRTRVLILGAGIAGMCTALELSRQGYRCHILEARERPGGRCFSIRRGTTVTDTDGETQTCEFDEGLYYNCGPARIPGHHVTLDYCREFGVAVEPMVNQNQAAFYYNTKGPLAGQRMRAREVDADADGHLAELLAKAVTAPALDQELSAEDRIKLQDYLRQFGGLARDTGKYQGTDRRGFYNYPSAGLQQGSQPPILALHDLLAGEYAARFFYYDINQQSQMFQIVGGTDNLAKALAARVSDMIEYNSPVREIRQNDTGVRVVYSHDGHVREATGDYLVCTIPLSVLRDIPGDFAPEVKKAIAGVHYHETGKIGIQFKRRFWEEDDRVFGGISWTDQTITQIMYPSTGFLGKKGVVVGYYTWEPRSVELGRLKHAGRLELALAQGQKIHEPYRREYENSFSVYWPKMQYTLGGWAEWTDVRGGKRPAGYELLNQPDGRIYLAGEHLSYLTGWMAGAFESARLTVAAIHTRASREQPGKAGVK